MVCKCGNNDISYELESAPDIAPLFTAVYGRMSTVVLHQIVVQQGISADRIHWAAYRESNVPIFGPTFLDCAVRQFLYHVWYIAFFLPKFYVGKPEGKRPLGRPRRRWEDNIKVDLQEVGRGCGDWMELAQDRDRWRALVSTIMNFRVP